MFQKNVLLKNHTSFKIGGPAKYFFEAKNFKDLVKAVKEAKQKQIPFFILGGGTKLLVNDKGFNGLIIKIKSSGFKIQENKIISEAGVSLARLVIASIKANLTGLEWAIEIPGTVGGAVHGNCGAFGSSLSKIVKNIVVFNPDSFKIKTYSNKQCEFKYRGSVFSAHNESASGEKPNRDIILSAELRLKKGNPKKSLAVIKEYLKRRRERISPYPSAGSIFKNYELKSVNYENDPLVKKFPELEKLIKGDKIPVAYLIEKCGLKGKKIGGAKISEKQANIIVNFNKAKAENVSALIDLAKKKVKKKFRIVLEEEVIMV
ncbi:MAG: UDP-N-acetylmuramate dehydrogenase [Patescibacteria group bacterium]